MEQLQFLNKIAIYGNKKLLSGKIKRSKKVILNILKDHKLKLDIIEINLITDDELLKMNKSVLKHDYYTDIITFDYCENKTVSGDLYISIDRTKENAKIFKSVPSEELIRVMFHGVLHLCGYKDKKKEDINIMREMENKYLEKFRKIK